MSMTQWKWVLMSCCLSCMIVAQAKIITRPAVLTLSEKPLYEAASAFPYANPQAPKGGELIQQALGSFDNFNGLIPKGNAAEGTGLLFDTLTIASLDEPFARYPLLAQSITYDDQDASWIIYHLNPAARFNDGTSVTASDVSFTFNTILREGHPGIRMYFADIVSVDALTPLDVKFVFRSKTNRELALTVGEVSILAKHDWQKRPFAKVSLVPPLGSGPYTVESFDAGRSVTYMRSPHYWGRDLMVNRGKYNFDRIKYRYYREEEIGFEGFKSGQYNFRAENKARTWATAYDFPAVRGGLVVKKLFPHKNPVAMQALVMNQRRPIFQSLALRQALTLAYDFEWMNKALFNGGYSRVDSYFYNSELASTGVPSSAEMILLKPLLPQLSPAERSSVLMPWQMPKSKGDGFNRENLLAARKLLSRHGFVIRHEQLYDAAGRAIRFEILLTQDGLQRVVLPWAEQLKKLGIIASIRMVDQPQYIERLRSFDFDVIIDQFPQSLSPGNEQMGYWSSASANQPGSNNTAGIKSTAVDTLLKTLIYAPNREALITVTHALDRVLLAGHYMVPMYGLPAYRIAYWNVFDMPERRPKYALGEDFWWYDRKRAAAVAQYLNKKH